MAKSPNRHLFLLGAALLLASCGDEGAGPGTPGSMAPGPGRPTPGPGSSAGEPGGPGAPNPGSQTPVAQPGQTDFTTEEASAVGRGGGGQSGTGASGAPGAALPPAPAPPPAVAPPGAPAPTPAPQPNPAAPTGRTGEVEEGDVYKVDGNRLFYLNTYRGFVIYDLNDPKNPQRLGRLPVFGYPVEMFVAGNTVYALLRDSLYLSQVGGNLQFERHNVSQLVTIDVSDPRNPRLLKTLDIVGELREGVARKVENTIYVVSYIPQSYYWGWRPDPSQTPNEQATVYSFNVADAQNPRQVAAFKIFEGGSISINDSQGNYYERQFEGVAISATANALMVAENWYVSASSRGPVGPGRFGCGSFNSNQFTRVSLIDISNPDGEIKLHARFETGGNLDDQFKMTYVDDPATATGTFYGIFARQVWASAGCQGASYTTNTLESWDVSVEGQPRRLDSLDFGKPDEVVRASAFDADRKVAYAITARRIDPLYALSFADRGDLQVASSIDGLSGEMSVFRLVADKKFLLAVGQDNSTTCAGLQGNEGLSPTKIAVSLIDVQNLAAIRLVQRQCVAVKNAEWIGSNVTNDLDQAHKMLGMHSDGQVNVLSVPIHYSRRVDSPDKWSFYEWQTAVGLMAWDLGRYVPARPAVQQNVIANYGTFVHPHGEVRRSVVFTHQGATPTRLMVNLSDTHISVANIQDLQNPTLESEIELAPYYNQIYRFGDYLVEQVQSKPNNGWWRGQDLATFRVKRAGGDLESTAPVASFEVGQVYRVLKHEQSLVLFRQSQALDPRAGIYVPPSSEALVVDLRDPTRPRLAGKVALPTLALPNYRYWCGMGAYWGGFWFEDVASFALTERGFAFFISEWRSENGRSAMINKLLFLDLRNPDAPAVSEKRLPDTYEWGSFGLVADPVAPAGFYISARKRVGESTTADGTVYTRYKYFAQRWEPAGESWAAVHDINTPGRLVRTWRSGAGERMFLAQDNNYRIITEQMRQQWVNDYRLSLLRQVTVGGQPAAELRDARVLTDLFPSALLVDGDKLLINGRPQKNYFWGGYGGGPVPPPPPGIAVPTAPPPPGPVAAFTQALADEPALPSWESTSDRLLIFDLAGGTLAKAYDQPTRMYNVQLMGTQNGKLFVNLTGDGRSYANDSATGDGILIVDVSNPRAPKGLRFLRTLGYATHIEFFDDDIYVAAGHFGLTRIDPLAGGELPVDPIQ